MRSSILPVPGQAQQWQQQWQVARSLGYAAGSAWWRVVAPGIWQAWRAPLLAVLAYSLTVVDVALVLGVGLVAGDVLLGEIEQMPHIGLFLVRHRKDPLEDIDVLCQGAGKADLLGR